MGSFLMEKMSNSLHSPCSLVHSDSSSQIGTGCSGENARASESFMNRRRDVVRKGKSGWKYALGREIEPVLTRDFTPKHIQFQRQLSSFFRAFDNFPGKARTNMTRRRERSVKGLHKTMTKLLNWSKQRNLV